MTVDITGLQVVAYLWDIDAAYMYSVKVDLASERRTTWHNSDTEVVPFGIRTIPSLQRMDSS